MPLVVAFALMAESDADAAGPTPGQIAFFETKVRPVLVEHCYECHSSTAKKIKGGLLLDTRAGWQQGGNSGPAIAPGDPDKSLLIKAVRQTDPDLQMPPKGPRLTAAEVADLETWVRMGAPDPREGPAVVRSAKDEGRSHWAFQPVRKPEVPRVSNTNWAKTPVDHFILAKLEDRGLEPNPMADRRTLIRRVYFDLIGLPPTPADVEAFLADASPDAFEKVVNRLLASPQYGERWGRHWLDVARYSDTKGEIRRLREAPNYPHAWTYRDYVIQAFNEDKPFNQFILEQIAADQLPGVRKNPATLAAMGFLTVGDRFMGQQNDIINDRIDVVTKGFLGLTVSCARCHDHKFDPIPTKDYYSLHGVFASSREPEPLPILRLPANEADYAAYYTQYTNLTQQIAEVERQFRALRRTRDGMSPSQRRELQRQAVRLHNELDRLEMTHPGAPVRAMALEDAARPKDSPVLIRGEAGNRGPTVPRQFLEVLAGPERKPFVRGSGRLELAQAIADPKNPLTARVIVNRVWLHHFGEGIVTTPDDFGTMSAPPSHPELLDYLAARLVEEGWSLKALHRLLCNSAVYQQSSAVQPRAAAVDPENRLLWRWNIQRLEFEAVRDTLLALAGKLDLTPGGRPEALTGERASLRRSVYGRIDRQNVPELLTHFDFANPDLPTGRRHTTTVPQQALFFMNSPLVIEAARSLVARTDFRLKATLEDRVRVLYEIVYQRPPSEEELRLGVEFVSQEPSRERVSAPRREPGANLRRARELREQGDFKELARMREQFRRGGGRAESSPRDPLTAWEEYAQALLQANELMFIH